MVDSAAPGRTSPAALVATAALALAAAAVVLVFFVSARKRSNYELCRGNLILVAIALRGGDPLDAPSWDEVPRGRAFLQGRHRWPMRQRRDLDLRCPVKGGGSEIDYRGPARPLRQIGSDEPVCADRRGNHGPGMGGNVLLKSGEVLTAAENDDIWRAADLTTCD